MKFLIPLLPAALIAWFFLDQRPASRQTLPAFLEEGARTAEPPRPEPSARAAPAQAHQQEARTFKNPAETRKPLDAGEVEAEKNAETPEHEYYRDTEFLSMDGRSRYFLSKEEIRERFPHGLPQEINLTEAGVHTRFFHPNGKGSGSGAGKTLYAADRESLERYHRFVEARNDEYRRRFESENAEEIKKNKFRQVARDDYDTAFQPGLRGPVMGRPSNKTVFVPEDIAARVKRLDFNLNLKVEAEDPGDEDLATITEAVLTLGHGGAFTATLAAEVSMLKGFEWHVYENAFDVKPENQEHHDRHIWYEIGEVGVSENGTDFEWLPCSRENPLSLEDASSFCAGTRPSSRGGNRYHIGLFEGKRFKTVRAIRVRDTGTNFNCGKFCRPGAAGFDLDALELTRVYVLEK